MVVYFLIGLWIWFIGWGITLALWNLSLDPDPSDPHPNAVWWPITWIKFLVKTFWIAITTGWKF